MICVVSSFLPELALFSLLIIFACCLALCSGLCSPGYYGTGENAYCSGPCPPAQFVICALIFHRLLPAAFFAMSRSFCDVFCFFCYSECRCNGEDLNSYELALFLCFFSCDAHALVIVLEAAELLSNAQRVLMAQALALPRHCVQAFVLSVCSFCYCCSCCCCLCFLF